MSYRQRHWIKQNNFLTVFSNLKTSLKLAAVDFVDDKKAMSIILKIDLFRVLWYVYWLKNTTRLLT